jgi:hypothetical protein
MRGCCGRPAVGSGSSDDARVDSKEPLRAWMPPPGWPTPPVGWAPPSPGWQPDVSWPVVPHGHQWWQLTRRGRRRRRNLILAVSLPVVLLVSAVGFGQAVDHGCGFDPPPGDYGSIRVVNDTHQAIGLFDCDNQTCVQGGSLQQLSVGLSASHSYELCGGGDIGVTTSTGLLIGCLQLPISDPPQTTHLLVSQAGRCSSTNGEPVLPTIHSST